MKKSKIFLSSITIILSLLCITTIKISSKLSEKTDNSVQQETTIQQSYLHPDIDYYENGVDTDYNYISNLGFLKDLDMPLVGMEQISDETDYILKQNGVTGEEVKITARRKKGSHILLEMSSSSGCIVNIDYQFTTNNLNIYIVD